MPEDNEYVICSVDTPSFSGRTYSNEMMQSAIDGVSALIREKRFLGELITGLDHPASSTISLENASHLVSGIRIDGTRVLAEIEPLNTPKGILLQEMLDNNAVAFGAVGLGKISGNIVTDYTLISIGAYPNLK